MNNENQQFQATPQPPPTPPRSGSGPEPIRAALFALVPGIGAVYNREYVKAAVHLTVFAGLVIIAESVGIFGLLAFSFYVYTIFDSYRSAELISQRPSLLPDETEEINMPFWGGIILLMGLLFLLDNLGAIRLRTAFQFWPVLLIFLGGYLLLKYFRSNRQAPRPEPPTRQTPYHGVEGAQIAAPPQKSASEDTGTSSHEGEQP